MKKYQLISIVWLLLVFLLSATSTTQGAEQNWTGEWRTMWRDGQALMTLKQDGMSVSGGYQPGDGRIEGTVNGTVLRGKWIEKANEGEIVFSLSADGNSFAGRFANGEFWNGERLTAGTYVVPYTRTDTPREILRTFLATLNAAYNGAISASLKLNELALYPGPKTNEYERRQRRHYLKRILDLTTLRIMDAPTEAESDRVQLDFAVLGTDWTYTMSFVETRPGRWRVLIPPLQELRKQLDEALTASGYESFGEYHQAQRNSPRGVLDNFLRSFLLWYRGGKEKVLGLLDLSNIPEQLRNVEGALAAEYLFMIVSRIGFDIMQEIPNDPEQTQEFVLYSHPAGKVAIGPLINDDGQIQWLFTAESVGSASTIFEALQNLPPAPGIPIVQPVTDYFRLRSSIKAYSPALVQRSLWFENWQWIGIVLMLSAAWILAVLGGDIIARLLRHIVDLAGGSVKAELVAKRSFVWPVRILVIGIVLTLGLNNIGLRQDVSSVLGIISALLIVIGATSFLLAVASVLGSWVSTRSSAQTKRFDAIMATLLAGIFKVAIIIGGFIAAADVIGLPYEGAIAGLGISGLALAIAARDTVSNFIGAAILLADRPFERGDLIEAGGTLATVEQVGLRSTRLRTLEDCLLIVPNSKLADDVVNNWGQRRKRRIILIISVTYDTSRELLDSFVGRLRETYTNQPLADSELYLGLQEFAASSIDVRLWGFFRVQNYEEYIDAKHKLMGDIVSLAEEMGVSFAFPTRTLHMVQDGIRFVEEDTDSKKH